MPFWKRLNNPNSFAFWISLAIITRIVISLGLSWNHQNLQPDNEFVFDFVFEHPDYGYFLYPVEQYFTEGMITYDGKTAFAGRMPGYSFPYLMLRHLFERDAALLVLIMFQILFAAVSVYLLAKIAWERFKSKASFYLVFCIALLVPHIAVFDYQTITESWSVSSFIAQLYFFHRYLLNRKNSDIFLSGFFLAWAVFLRPFLGVALALVGIALLIDWRSKKATFLNLLLFSLSFMVFELAWITRNYVAKDQLIVLNSGLAAYGKIYSPGYQAIRKLMYRLGEETAYVDPGMAAWMRGKTENFNSRRSYNEQTIIKKSELLSMRETYLNSRDLEGSAFIAEDSLIKEEAGLLLDKLKKEDRLTYFFSGPIYGLKKLWIHSGSPYMAFPPFSEMNLIQKSIKLLALISYYSIILGGLLTLILLSFNTTLKVYFVVFPLVLSLALVLVSTIQEARYLICAFPIYILLIGALPLIVRNYRANKKLFDTL